MKLYRGLKSKEFSMFSPAIARRLRETWRDVLARRESGDLSYPEDLNGRVISASKLIRLQRQHFTDCKAIALTYARANEGVLVEIEIPASEVVKHFTIEFQNFARRKKQFEIVYVIDSERLALNAKKWKFRALPLGRPG